MQRFRGGLVFKVYDSYRITDWERMLKPDRYHRDEPRVE